MNLKALLKLCVFLDWGLSFLVYSIAFKANDTHNLTLLCIVGAMALVLTLYGLVLNYTKKGSNEQKVALYFGISTIAYSWAFLWMYYEILYKIAFLSSPIYLVLGLTGYVVFTGFVLYYKYKVYKGDYKNKSGVPKYSVITSVTIFGSLIAKGYFEKPGGGVKPFIIAGLTLLISYVFSIGVAQIFDYWLLSKSKKVFKVPDLRQLSSDDRLSFYPEVKLLLARALIKECLTF